METRLDAIIVGSGPAGVSVAFPLLAAGMRVAMIDGGRQRQPDSLAAGPYHERRRESADQWRVFLGERLEALRGSGPPSPKFDAPGSRFAYEDFAASQRIEGDNFTVVGSLASGGLSNIWGAGVCAYDEDDLHGFPIAPADLADSYPRVAGRMGITGIADDDLATGLESKLPRSPPLQLAANAQLLLKRYDADSRSVVREGLRLGRARAAVLTEPRHGRGACTRCDMCLWGCREEAIYSASHDLDTLTRDARLQHFAGSLAERIVREPAGYCVILSGRPAAGETRLRAPRLILAASTLATTRLVLELEGRFDEDRKLVGTPTAGFALLIPARLGRALSSREFSMGQLSFLADGPGTRPGDRAFGTLFPASGIPGSLTVERIPFTRPGAVRLFRGLQPALLLANVFLPGRYSDNVLRLKKRADGLAGLAIRGGVNPELAPRLRFLRRQLERGFRRLGAWMVPRSFTPLTPGEDLRYCGTLPLRADPGPCQVDPSGQLHGYPGLSVVDLSIFPTMPAKHHSLTLMANADRIGHAIANRFSTGGNVA